MPKIVQEYGLGLVGSTILNLDPNGKVVRVAAVLDNSVEQLRIWVLEEQGVQQTRREFLAAINNQPVPNNVIYQGTATFESGEKMTHVFEVV